MKKRRSIVDRLADRMAVKLKAIEEGKERNPLQSTVRRALFRSIERLRKKYNPIRIWPFEYAPQRFQEFSASGGDEDWVAFVPDWVVKEMGVPGFLWDATPFGNKVQEIDVDDEEFGSGKVLIGSHA